MLPRQVAPRALAARCPARRLEDLTEAQAGGLDLNKLRAMPVLLYGADEEVDESVAFEDQDRSHGNA